MTSIDSSEGFILHREMPFNIEVMYYVNHFLLTVPRMESRTKSPSTRGRLECLCGLVVPG
jgi:hypothetical protein